MKENNVNEIFNIDDTTVRNDMKSIIKLLELNDDDARMLKRFLKVDIEDVKLLNKNLPEFKRIPYSELKDKIGTSFTIVEVEKDKPKSPKSYQIHKKYIVSEVLNVTEKSMKEDIHKLNSLMFNIINTNEKMKERDYIAQEVFSNTEEHNKHLNKEYLEIYQNDFGKAYKILNDDDTILKKDFLSLKMNDKEISEGIDEIINEIIIQFYNHYHVFLPESNCIKNMFKPKTIRKKIDIVNKIICKLRETSKNYIERPIDDRMRKIETFYLKDIGNSFNTYEIPEIIDNKIYAVDKATLSVKEFDAKISFSLDHFDINELNKGIFYINFTFENKDNKSISDFQIHDSEPIIFGDYFVFLKKDDAVSFSNYKIDKLMNRFDQEGRIFSSKTLNQLVSYFNEVKKQNNKT